MAVVRETINLTRNYVSLIPKRLKSTNAVKLTYSNYGEPSEVVHLEKECLESPGPGQVLIKMLAAPINPADINTIQGVYPAKPPLPSIPGNEGVGRVSEVGEGVKNLKVGDLVIPGVNLWGTWRSHAVTNSKQVMKVAPGVDIVAAATISVNPCTAYRMLKDFVELCPGDVVIQNGANSACGQSVIQFCKIWGFKTVNIVRNRPDFAKMENELKGLGADYVLIDENVPNTDIFKKGLPKPKLALNCVGGKNALNMLRHLDTGGVMVTYGGMSREPVTVPTSALIFKDITVKGFWMTAWNKKNSGSSDHVVMVTEISSFNKDGLWKPPAHELVTIEQYKDVLSKAMNISGKAGRKFIFNLKDVAD